MVTGVKLALSGLLALALRPAYDSGDHLHPNSAGYHAMADAIDLRLVQ
jgi:lysophospholipase L1-like esterase